MCNEVYAPSEISTSGQSAILEAYAGATVGDRIGAVMFEGEMIDEASRKMAEQIVARGRERG